MRHSEHSLERAADKLLSRAGARFGEYPAYCERELRYRAKSRGEVLESELESVLADDRDYPNGLLEHAPRPWDCVASRFVRGRVSRVHPGYGILARHLAELTPLSRIQRDVMNLALEGCSIRQTARRLRLPKSTVARELRKAARRVNGSASASDLGCDVQLAALWAGVDEEDTSPMRVIRLVHRSIMQNGGELAELETPQCDRFAVESPGCNRGRDGRHEAVFS